jgi:pyrroloquinoline quinone biosynthesis protein D
MNFTRPKRNPAVVWRPEPSGLARIEAGADPGTTPCATLVHLGTMHQLNHVAAEIWTRCDGTRTLEELAAELTVALDAPPDAVLRDTEAFLADMAAHGWLTEGSWT